MIRFTRKLCKKITNTGDTCYTLAIPREIAEVLRLEDGGLVSLEARYRYDGDRWIQDHFVIKNYDDSIKATTEIFDPLGVHSGDGTYGFVDVEIEPKTKGPSRVVEEGRITDFRHSIQQLRAALRFVATEQRRAGLVPSGGLVPGFEPTDWQL